MWWIVAFNHNDALTTIEDTETGERRRILTGDLYEFYNLYDIDENIIQYRVDDNE